MPKHQAGATAGTFREVAVTATGHNGRRAINLSFDAYSLTCHLSLGQHMRDDLTSLTLRIQDDLQAIARVFAEVERYHAAVQIQGFSSIIAAVAAEIGGPAVTPCESPTSVKLAS